MIAWGRPQLLWLLPLCAIAARLAWAQLRRRERAMAELIEPALWPAVIPGHDPRRPRRRLALRFAALALVTAALARPQWGEREEVVRRRGLQIVVALDVSKSMLAPDLKPSRLQQAKWGIRDLVARLHGDRLALVAFAGTAFVQCPLTSDYGAFLMLLDDVSTDTIPRGGTAIGAAIRTSISAFDPEGGGDRVVMLVTDGESHEDDPLETVAELRARGIRVYAVGVGTPEGELIALSDGGFLKDRAGLTVKAGLREDVLAKLAAATDGAYVRATPGDLGLDRLYEEHVARLQRAEHERKTLRAREERFALLLGAALLLLLIESVLAGHVARATRTVGAIMAVVLLCGSASADDRSAREHMREGLRHYESKRWADAASAFDAAARAAPAERLDPAVARLNEALARLRAGDPAAEAALEQALRTTDRGILADALYNRGWLRANRAAAARNEGRWPDAQTNAALAAADFRDTLLLRPSDHDARVNYELARELLEEIVRNMTNASQSQAQSEEHSSPNRPEPSPSDQGRSETEPQPHESSAEQPSMSNEPQPGEQDATATQGEPPRDEGRQRSQMTREEAEMLLDQIKAEEGAIRWRTRPRAPPVPVEKDW